MDDGTLRTEMRLMTGANPLKRKNVAGARFGSAIAGLGDLDGDGYEEFAVGAPGEGDGAVYIYRGSRIFRFSGEKKVIYSLNLLSIIFSKMSLKGSPHPPWPMASQSDVLALPWPSMKILIPMACPTLQ